MSEQTITGLHPADLENGLRNATLFADKDGSIPTLNAVHITVRDGDLITEATDRYRLIEVNMTSRGSSKTDDETAKNIGAQEFSVILPLDDAKRLIPLLKTPRNGHAPPVTLKHDTETNHLSVECELFGVMRFGLRDGHYPALQNLFVDTGNWDNPGISRIGVNPNFLADLGRVRDHRMVKSHADREPLTMFLQEASKPMHFTRGDWMRAVIMPIRINVPGVA